MLQANVVDNMSLQPHSQVVAYFFCRADSYESRKPRATMGCLARQILEASNLDAIGRLWKKAISPKLDGDGIERLFKSEPIKNQKLCFIHDGIDECSPGDRKLTIRFLVYLQSCMSVKICISSRLMADQKTLLDFEPLAPGTSPGNT